MISLEGKVKSISNSFHILQLTFHKKRTVIVKHAQVLLQAQPQS